MTTVIFKGSLRIENVIASCQIGLSSRFFNREFSSCPYNWHIYWCSWPNIPVHCVSAHLIRGTTTYNDTPRLTLASPFISHSHDVRHAMNTIYTDAGFLHGQIRERQMPQRNIGAAAAVVISTTVTSCSSDSSFSSMQRSTCLYESTDTPKTKVLSYGSLFFLFVRIVCVDWKKKIFWCNTAWIENAKKNRCESWEV